MNLTKIMAALEAKLSETAKEAVERPAAGDIYAYGRVVGTYAGLNMAKQIIEEMWREEQKRYDEL